MMRLARIVRDATDLDGSVRSLPTPCNNVQASNASQSVRVLLKSNASGVSTMTQSPHARHGSVRERRDAQKGPLMSGIGGPVSLRRWLDHSGATLPTLRSPHLQFCDHPQLLTERQGKAPVVAYALPGAFRIRGVQNEPLLSPANCQRRPPIPLEKSIKASLVLFVAGMR